MKVPLLWDIIIIITIIIAGLYQVAVCYEACAESRYTKVLNMYDIFNLQKRHCEWIAGT